MAGLLDDFKSFINTPEGVGLLSTVFGGLAGARPGQPLNNIGRAGMSGLMGYSNAQDQQSKLGEADQMKQLRDFQIQQMQQQQAQDAATKQAFADSYQSPGSQAISTDSLGPTNNKAAMIPNFSPQMDIKSAINKLYSINPALAMKMQKTDPIKLGAGDTLLDPTTYKTLATGQEKSPTTPSSVQEYEYAKTQGYKGSFQDWITVKSNERPYYQFLPTAEGIVAGNSRTGALTTPTNGTNFIRSSDNPALQGKIAASKSIGTAEGTAQGSANTTLANNIYQAKNALQQADDLLKAPGLSTALGLSGKLDPRNYIAGTDAANFHARVDQLLGGQFMTAYQTLKGGGQITEVEGKKATDAIARMSTATSAEAFTQAVNDYKTIINAGMERARRQAKGDFGELKSPVPADTSQNNGFRIVE